MNKKYLHELEEKGVTIVKSLWHDEFDKKKIHGSFEELDTEQIIIKPLDSASAFNTFGLDKNEHNHSPFSASMKKLEKVFSDRSFIIQPFVKNIITEGEYSLFYFNNEFSH